MYWWFIDHTVQRRRLELAALTAELSLLLGSTTRLSPRVY